MARGCGLACCSSLQLIFLAPQLGLAVSLHRASCANHKPIVLPPGDVNVSETRLFKQLAMCINTWMLMNHMISQEEMALQKSLPVVSKLWVVTRGLWVHPYHRISILTSHIIWHEMGLLSKAPRLLVLNLHRFQQTFLHILGQSHLLLAPRIKVIPSVGIKALILLQVKAAISCKWFKCLVPLYSWLNRQPQNRPFFIRYTVHHIKKKKWKQLQLHTSNTCKPSHFWTTSHPVLWVFWIAPKACHYTELQLGRIVRRWRHDMPHRLEPDNAVVALTAAFVSRVGRAHRPISLINHPEKRSKKVMIQCSKHLKMTFGSLLTGCFRAVLYWWNQRCNHGPGNGLPSAATAAAMHLHSFSIAWGRKTSGTIGQVIGAPDPVLPPGKSIRT